MKLLKRKLFSLLCVIVCISCFISIFLVLSDKKTKNNKYCIDCSVNKNILSAVMTLEYYNNTGVKQNELCFCLYPNAFKNEENVLNVAVRERLEEAYPNGFDNGYINVSSVKVNGKETEFTLEENEQILVIDKLKIGKGKHKTVEITFDEKLPNSPMRYGYYDDTYNFGNWYPVLCPKEQGEAVKTVYVSNGDPFYSEVADYEVNITASKNMRIASTGVIENKNFVGLEDAVWKIKAENVRDFAFVMSDKFKLLSEKAGNTIVYSYFYSDESQGKQALENCVEAVNYFNEIYGEYPYSSLSVAESDFYIGGMEYPNLVLISDELYPESEALEEVVVHETAHQWWYGIVGNNELKEPWLDEGLTEYSVGLFLENKYGKERYNMFVRENEGYCKVIFNVTEKIYGNADKKIDKSSNEFENWMMYDALTYDGASVMLDGLRKTMGRERFLAGMKNYFECKKYGVSSRNDFIKYFSDGCGNDVSSYIEPWLDGNVYWG